MGNAPPWLTARPIAHRGFHDASRGVVENTLGAADQAAVRGFSIECDVGRSADGEAMVFHDDALDRLTLATGPLECKTAAELKAIRLKASAEAIPTFPEFLARVAGRVPIICEIKSAFDGDTRLAERVAEIAAGYSGRLALKSFDPAIIAHFREGGRPPGPEGAPCPLGVVAEAHYADPSWSALTAAQKVSFSNFLHYSQTQPDFLSYCVDDLPHAVPFLLRALKATPIMVWTVRTEAQRRIAAEWADQIVFEGDPSG
jgi:glycerophosphoryl diester phosphodiesterase